jgi:hypothetical protein
MCEKRVELDRNIDHYRGIASRITDDARSQESLRPAVFSSFARIDVRNERGANDADWGQIGRGYNLLLGCRN